MRISRKIHFCAGRRYRAPGLSEAENLRLFGPAGAPSGHGANFTAEATVEGRIDPATGMVMNLTDLDAALKEIVDPLDHKMLDADIPHFRETVPTNENLAIYLWEGLKGRLPAGCRLSSVRVYEDPTFHAEYRGE